MARKNTRLTSKGIDFITYICSGNSEKNGGNKPKGDKLLKGNNNILQYSNKVDKTWEANIVDDNGNSINKNEDLALVLISNFQRWATTYNIDPNILAAQCYVLTKYRMWYYDSYNSGVNLFSMPNVYKYIISNSSSITPKMTEEEISIITAGLTNPDMKTSYDVVNGGAVMTSNRPILHQNMIDNPAIMIKAQARYLKYLAENQSSKLASTTLFSYSAGEQYAEITYTRSIEKANNLLGNNLVTKATDIVLKIFAVLGDKDNVIVSKFKPKGYWFAYDLDFTFDAFDANKEESKQFDDIIDFDTLSIINEYPKYRTIYFSEKNYRRQIFNKKQIFLHHTVSGPSVSGDINLWNNQGEDVATAFILTRKGEMVQLFSTDYWAFHTGLGKNYDKQNIGIELDSWGGLIKDEISGNWFPAKHNKVRQYFEPNYDAGIVTNVQTYNHNNGYPLGFRGFFGFEKYPDEQIEATKELILSINEKYPDIILKFNSDMWDINYDNEGNPIGTVTGGLGLSQKALNGAAGVWTHVCVAKGNSDCHPQPELIKMLQELEEIGKNN